MLVMFAPNSIQGEKRVLSLLSAVLNPEMFIIFSFPVPFLHFKLKSRSHIAWPIECIGYETECHEQWHVFW